MNPQKALRGASIFIDVLTALCFATIVFLTIDSWPIYKLGQGIFEYPFEILYYLVLVRLVLLVPWKKFLGWTAPRQIFAVVVWGVFMLFLHNLFFVNFKSAVNAIILTRASFQGATDEEIAIDITEHNKWYPQMSFVLQIMEQVPEDASIAYFGDQRGHIMSYLLYPRKVYSLPVMQEVLNQSIQENWTWSDLEDPFHPQKDPMDPVVQSLEAFPTTEQIQADFQSMVEAKGIEWVICYNSLYPELSWFKRLP